MDTAASEQVHRLADTTYRNVEELVVNLRTMATAARTYHKAMETMRDASEEFTTAMQTIGAKAANLPGSVRKLGDCMCEMSSGYEQLNEGFQDWMESFTTDFIVPLESKLEMEGRSTVGMHKLYKEENGKREALVEKTTGKLKKVQKKKNQSRSETEKEQQLKQVLNDYSEELHSMRVEGLRKALIEERKLHCFVVDHFCSVVHNQIAYNALSHRVLSTRVTDWSSLCSSPSELPPESAILLVDPRSPRAFPIASSHISGPGGEEGGGTASTDGGGGQPAKGRARRVSCRVKALYPHQITTNEQLDFTPGDLIDAIDDPQDGWQYGESTRTGRTGWFPSQFVEKIWPTPEPRRRKRPDEDSLRSPSGPPAFQAPPSIPEKDYGSGRPLPREQYSPGGAGRRAT